MGRVSTLSRETDAAPALNTKLGTCFSRQLASGNLRVHLGKVLVGGAVAKAYEIMWLRVEASKMLLMCAFPYSFNKTTNLSPRPMSSVFGNGQFGSLYRQNVSADEESNSTLDTVCLYP